MPFYLRHHEKLSYCLDSIYSFLYTLVIYLLEAQLYSRFSPIENMFGYTKAKLKDFKFKNKEELTMKITELMFSCDEARIMSFYRKTLSNMLEFWTKLDKGRVFGDNV